jgi:RNA polymerase sigma-70 factor (ECF subfamily)
LRNSEDVEDAAQEALLRAWRQRTACRTSVAPATWMRQIARNEALRLVARRPAEQSHEDLGEEADPCGAGADRSLLQMAVRTALREFEQEDRLLIYLRYTEDLPQLHIAGLLGIPEGTVKVRLHRIRQRLRPALSDVE